MYDSWTKKRVYLANLNEFDMTIDRFLFEKVLKFFRISRFLSTVYPIFRDSKNFKFSILELAIFRMHE